MISPFMPPVDKSQQFEQLLELALAGEGPPTESGLAAEVIDALMNVASERTPESAQSAREIYDSIS